MCIRDRLSTLGIVKSFSILKIVFLSNPVNSDNFSCVIFALFLYSCNIKMCIRDRFIASIAIHESAWGTSQIAQEKHNLFGYGSYDQTPYESSRCV